MTTLIAGDIRQDGDKQRRKLLEKFDYQEYFRKKYIHEFRWRPVDLVGHVILPADLFIHEFSRP